MAKIKISKIRRRDGTIQEFNLEKLEKSIQAAAFSALRDEKKSIQISKKISQSIVESLQKSFGKKIVPSVEDIRDVLNAILKKQKKLTIVLQKYNSFKPMHKNLGFRTYLGVRDDIGLSHNSIRVLSKRYLLRNNQGVLTETPSRLFRRVAKHIANIDREYDSSLKEVKELEEQFFQMMSKLEFLPNSPTLMNAGTKNNQLSACFVLPVHDNLRSIFHAIEEMALIHQSGGGTGFDFSHLRPKGELIKSNKGRSSGALSFMSIFDKATEVIKQGGKRRGANMAILRVDHPDIFDFINAKRRGELTNFNTSVAITNKFMKAVESDSDFALINPSTGQITSKVKAQEIFNLIVENAWENGDPGLVFIDEINKHNFNLGTIEATSPCGEQALLPFESSNLGSINLAKMFDKGKFNWEKFRRTIKKAIHFLDNVIDANKYPMPQIEEITKENRKIGLGIMGFADCLAKQKIAYDSKKAFEFAEKLMKFLSVEARKTSANLATKKGNFPNFDIAKGFDKKRFKTMRNATVTTIAPTGSISLIANCSSGIEPNFAIAFIRELMEGNQMLEVNFEFENLAKEKGFYSKQLMMKIAKKGSVKSLANIPPAIRKVFTTSMDITPTNHVKMQSLFQKYVDNAVSKTVNLPENASKADVKKIFLQAYEEKCKGITIYRYGSKKNQILTFGKKAEEHIKAKSEFASCIKSVCYY